MIHQLFSRDFYSWTPFLVSSVSVEHHTSVFFSFSLNSSTVRMETPDRKFALRICLHGAHQERAAAHSDVKSTLELRAHLQPGSSEP